VTGLYPEAGRPDEDFDERDHREPVRRRPSSHHSAQAPGGFAL